MSATKASPIAWRARLVGARVLSPGHAQIASSSSPGPPPWRQCGLQVGSEDVLAADASGAGDGHSRAQLDLGAAGDGVDVLAAGEVGGSGEGQVHALAHHGAD
ncbi:hypothetical protein [Kitasatospora purpeofusca]|uniref:hypothetical protein n=1 Tax=Kitasatospora purpeofusca TaxID=67352 RepID=UPI0036D342FA